MDEAEHGDPAADPDAPRTFRETRLSRWQDLQDFAQALRNYADLSLVVHARSGDVVRRRLPRRGLWLFHPRHLRRVLRTNVRNYRKNVAYEALRPLIGDGLILSDGELWARHRRIVAPEFREAVIARYLPTMVREAEGLLGEWSASVDRGPRDISRDMQRLTLRVVAGAMFRSDLRREAEVIGDALEVCLKQATRQMLSVGLLRPWMPTPGNLAARRAAAEIDRVVRAIIARGRAGEVGEHDVLSRLLVATDRETGARLPDQQIIDEVKTLILAGHETTGLALSWTLYLLAQHPELEARLVAELRRVLGARPLEAADVPALVYTRMVLLEAMRLYPPVPAVPREAIDDDAFDGIRVRAGDNIIAMIYAAHRHPEYWQAPERFDPERFAPGRAEAIDPYAYLPFLRGRRACIGDHFALLEGVVLLAMLLRRFRLERSDDRPIATRPISTLRLARPLMMRPRPRDA